MRQSKKVPEWPRMAWTSFLRVERMELGLLVMDGAGFYARWFENVAKVRPCA